MIHGLGSLHPAWRHLGALFPTLGDAALAGVGGSVLSVLCADEGGLEEPLAVEVEDGVALGSLRTRSRSLRHACKKNKSL